MHIVIGTIAALLIRIGLQWIFGKGWGLFLTFLWLAAFVFFGLTKVAPPFPFHLFKGASFTAGTFIALGVIFAPFIIAKIGIQGSTQDKAKAWVGGFLFFFMSLSVVAVWFLMSALDLGSRPNHDPLAEERTLVEPTSPPSGSAKESTRKKQPRTKTKTPKTEETQSEKPTD